ncbi:MAG: flavoprotein [Syntrophomonadaceae bacterium]|nr:flavoprotein [Syntrophomonadaceae bacterium]
MTEIDKEKLITLVLAELAKQSSQPAAQKILAVFSGGMIGLETVLAQMQQLQQAGYQFEIVLTPNATTVIAPQSLRQSLGPVPVHGESDDFHQITRVLAECDAVLIPVMTMNTAAKVVNGISDNLATTLIMIALLSGKSIIGVKDACDPRNQCREQMGHNKAAQAYRALLTANIERLKDYGMELCDSKDLAITVQHHLNKPTAMDAVIPENQPAFTGKILSVADLPGTSSTITVSPRTIITPAAKDAIKERGIEVVIC